MLRDGPGLRVFFGGVLLGVGGPSLAGALLRGGVAWTWIAFGVVCVAVGMAVLARSARTVTVFDARISTVVVVRRSMLGGRTTVRRSLADVSGLSVSGRRLVLELVDAPVVPLSAVSGAAAVAAAHAAVTSFLLGAARPR